MEAKKICDSKNSYLNEGQFGEWTRDPNGRLANKGKSNVKKYLVSLVATRAKELGSGRGEEIIGDKVGIYTYNEEKKEKMTKKSDNQDVGDSEGVRTDGSASLGDRQGGYEGGEGEGDTKSVTQVILDQKDIEGGLSGREDVYMKEVGSRLSILREVDQNIERSYEKGVEKMKGGSGKRRARRNEASGERRT